MIRRRYHAVDAADTTGVHVSGEVGTDTIEARAAAAAGAVGVGVGAAVADHRNSVGG